MNGLAIVCELANDTIIERLARAYGRHANGRDAQDLGDAIHQER